MDPKHTTEAPSAMPDEFDRLTGLFDGLGTATADSIVPVVPTLGVGGTRKFIIKTVRHEGEDYVFIEMISRDRSFREVLPPDVTAAIARQRDSLTAKNRRKGARQAAETRKAKGIVPSFQRRKK